MLLLCRRLVVEGLYRYTRNPMFWGAFSVVFGEALIFNSRHLLYYFLLVVAMQMVHVPLNEERWLRRGFGAEYEEYCRQVFWALDHVNEVEYASESHAVKPAACLVCDARQSKAGLQTWPCAMGRVWGRACHVCGCARPPNVLHASLLLVTSHDFCAVQACAEVAAAQDAV